MKIRSFLLIVWYINIFSRISHQSYEMRNLSGFPEHSFLFKRLLVPEHANIRNLECSSHSGCNNLWIKAL